MSLPTTASRSIEISAPPEVVYDLLSDVTRTGEWSPECRSCEWVAGPGGVGARVQGPQPARPRVWTTTAEVIEADRPRTFAFATLLGDGHSTRWRYELAVNGAGTTLTESFESVAAPFFINLAERLFIRNRQEQLEEGLAKTLGRIKAIAEG